jgi:hypothetical protein
LERKWLDKGKAPKLLIHIWQHYLLSPAIKPLLISRICNYSVLCFFLLLLMIYCFMLYVIHRWCCLREALQRAYEKRLRTGISQASPLAQTSCLEGFHSVLNHFAPKMIAFSFQGMYCRSVYVLQ